MVWTFVSMIFFVVLFFIGSVQLQGAQSIVFQVIGFGGMIFSLLYGLLISQHSSQRQQEHDKSFPE
ncbi:hypothetical protein ACFPTR_01945 [Aliibacillus thermotolerans]|uniref:DUF5325 family protein n=1 Tax=Aliibacillus thermotolerans TaxID=1834418 RepID=A0ABW0U5M1_9BACI|nr:hypothetical protein [Aliibacillus thermotolerans]MDA3130016.1 hypothetical protein [Aliibacillus thermotolerans]